MVRIEADFSTNPIKAKIANAVAVRIHGKGQQGVKPRAEVVADILAAVRERRA